MVNVVKGEVSMAVVRVVVGSAPTIAALALAIVVILLMGLVFIYFFKELRKLLGLHLQVRFTFKVWM